MKKILLILLLAACAASGFAQNAPITKANYDLAARFSPDNLKRMVFSTSVDAHWLKQSERFWYVYETSSGKTWYLVDPVKRLKKPLFDPARMAADMSRLSKDPFDAQHLDIENLRFIKNETAIQFEVKSKLAEEEPKKDGEENDMQEKKPAAPAKKEKRTFHFEYDLNTGTLRLLDDYEKPKDKPSWANIAPDSSYVLFSKDHNLFWMDKENFLKALKNEKDSTIVEHQWTTDGVEHYAYGGGFGSQTNVEMETPVGRRPLLPGLQKIRDHPHR